MADSLPSEVVGTLGLGLVAATALLLTVLRVPIASRSSMRRVATALFTVGLVLHFFHFVEEYSTGFYERFPLVFGLSPWSSGFFVTFNLAWFAVWATAAFGLRAGYRMAYFPVWFFAIAMMVNGVAHPMLAVRAGGYFPGLITSPLVGIVGVLLWFRLLALTEPRWMNRTD